MLFNVALVSAARHCEPPLALALPSRLSHRVPSCAERLLPYWLRLRRGAHAPLPSSLLAPHSLPLCPQGHPLRRYSCPARKFICTIFLDSIRMCSRVILVRLFSLSPLSMTDKSLNSILKTKEDIGGIHIRFQKKKKRKLLRLLWGE